MSGQPSLLKSPTVAPRPRWSAATPQAPASSVKVPLPLLMYSASADVAAPPEQKNIRPAVTVEVGHRCRR